jgi:energy-converting hydrogenase A subunit R
VTAVVNTDCEGPTAINDNAYDLADQFLPKGSDFFEVLSTYVRHLAFEEHRPGYSGGDTLRLLLPFLKAAGVTNADAARVARTTLQLVPGVTGGIRRMMSHGLHVFEISSGYRPFAYEVARRIGLPPGHVYCSDFELDGHRMDPAEAAELLEVVYEIAAQSVRRTGGQISTTRVDEILGSVGALKAFRTFAHAGIMNSDEKRGAIVDAVRRSGMKLSQSVYIGDGLTDVGALDFVRSAGGLTISFNAREEIIRHADVACAAKTAYPVFALVMTFADHGKQAALDLASSWSAAFAKRFVDPDWVDRHSVQFDEALVGWSGYSDLSLLVAKGREDSRLLRGTVVTNLP